MKNNYTDFNHINLKTSIKTKRAVINESVVATTIYNIPWICEEQQTWCCQRRLVRVRQVRGSEAALSELVSGRRRSWSYRRPWPYPPPSAAAFPSGPSGCIRSVNWDPSPAPAHRTSRTDDWILVRSPLSARHGPRSCLNDTTTTTTHSTRQIVAFTLDSAHVTVVIWRHALWCLHLK